MANAIIEGRQGESMEMPVEEDFSNNEEAESMEEVALEEAEAETEE